MDTTLSAGRRVDAGGGAPCGGFRRAGSGLLAAMLSLSAAGCYTDRCVKMGYAVGTPQNGQCVQALQTEMTGHLKQMTQELNNLSETLAEQRQQKEEKKRQQKEARQRAQQVPSAAGFYGGGPIGQVPPSAFGPYGPYGTWGGAPLPGYGY